MTARSSAFSAQRSARLDTLFQRIARLCSIAVMLIGGLVILGWILDIGVFKSILPQLAPMKPNTALGLILAGCSLRFLQFGPTDAWKIGVARAGAVLIVLLGALTLSEYIVGWNLGIDQLLFKDAVDAAGLTYPGRMAEVSSINFVCVGLAALLLDLRQAYWMASALLYVVVFLAWVAGMGYLLGINALQSVGLYTNVAIHTAVAFTLLSIGLLCTRPERGLVALLRSATAGGLMIRQYFIALIHDITDRKRAEVAQYEAAARLAGIVGSVMDAIVSIDEAQNIVLFNTAAEQMFRCSAATVMGRSIDQFIPLYLRHQHAGHVRTFSATGVTNRSMMSLGERMAVRADGEEFPIEATISQITIAGEKIYTVVIRDITERKHADQAIQRYTERLKHLREIDQAMLTNSSLEQIAQAALTHVWQMIPSTRVSVMLVDMAAQTITLFAVQVKGELRVPPGLQASIEIIGAALEPLKRGQVYQVPDIAALPEPPAALRAAQVEHVRAYAYVPIMSDTDLIGLLCLGSDRPGAFLDESIDIAMELAGQLAIAIDQARLRAEIEHYAAELEQRVAMRTAELAAANKELEAFSYSVSHDLRAPLRAIAGFSRILIEEYLPDLPEEAHDYLLLVRDNARQMDLLINDLLDFARLGRQPLHKQPVAPTDLVRQVIAELSGEQAERDVAFVVADLPICAADPALLRQVYINLLANALKFTSKRAAARIEVGALTTPDLPGETVYFVRDNGAGFDMRYAGKLFGVFQRLHRAEDYAGTGVGLAIVQRVVHRHGGRVWAESAVDQGATFYFTLGGSATHV